MIKKLLALAAVITLCGCTWGDYRATNYFDLQTPAVLPKVALPVSIARFDNASGVRQNIVYRAGDSLQRDEYNKFIDTPDRMIERYLTVAFSDRPGITNATGDRLMIRGKIFLFEFDTERMEAAIGVEYIIDRRNADGLVLATHTGSSIYRSQATGTAPDVVTRAFSRCAAQFADALYTITEGFKAE